MPSTLFFVSPQDVVAVVLFYRDTEQYVTEPKAIL
jgi:hypothetical protein